MGWWMQANVCAHNTATVAAQTSRRGANANKHPRSSSWNNLRILPNLLKFTIIILSVDRKHRESLN
jgi:hypothetical protein